MQSKIRAGWLGAAGVALIVGAGCGGDGDGGGGTSGVSGAKPLSDVSDAEAKELCEWAEGAVYEPSEKELCTAVSAAFTSTEAECEASVADCLKDGSEVGVDEGEESCDDASADELPANCTATVAEFEACFNALSDATRATFSAASCADAGKAEQESESPAACKALDQKCPGFFEDDSAEGGGSSGADGELGSFTCANGNVVADVFVCDGQDDCEDGSDEQGC